jgi:hypothetical protein
VAITSISRIDFMEHQFRMGLGGISFRWGWVLLGKGGCYDIYNWVLRVETEPQRLHRPSPSSSESNQSERLLQNMFMNNSVLGVAYGNQQMLESDLLNSFLFRHMCLPVMSRAMRMFTGNGCKSRTLRIVAVVVGDLERG